ncbi:unnamed protein product [Plutella xylostella]|uniref:(diamondback moth) hypothetical protein n=1 Tax=Plutella xylostella TaxID=51655 RepID=A0A8S4DVM8_PLUXY|nr:unnamed protein product [Plutella xylostella]
MMKCDAEIVIKSKFIEKDGQDYIQFDKLNMDITVRDYRVKLDGLFNGDKTLGDAANEAINQNRGEFLKASKPYVEKTASKILLETANKIASTFPIDDLLPNP